MVLFCCNHSGQWTRWIKDLMIREETPASGDEMRKGPDGLTDKQRRFADNLAAGMSQRQARAAAGYSTNMPLDVQDSDACRKAALDAVKKRIADLQAQVDAGALLTLDQIAADVGRIATDEGKPDGVRLKAYDQLSRLQGGYTDVYRVDARTDTSLTGIEGVIQGLLAGKTAAEKKDA